MARGGLDSNGSPPLHQSLNVGPLGKDMLVGTLTLFRWSWKLETTHWQVPWSWAPCPFLKGIWVLYLHVPHNVRLHCLESLLIYLGRNSPRHLVGLTSQEKEAGGTNYSSLHCGWLWGHNKWSWSPSSIIHSRFFSIQWTALLASVAYLVSGLRPYPWRIWNCGYDPQTVALHLSIYHLSMAREWQEVL